MQFAVLVLMAFVMVACGDSYIVNNQDTRRRDEITAECALYFKTENLCLTTEWETMPTVNSFGSMLLTFKDKSDPSRIISPRHEPFVLLWMPGHGHGSSPVTMTLIEDGKYRASDIFFIMPGAWDIRFQLKDGTNIIEETVQKVTL
jgi:hypothetical protein